MTLFSFTSMQTPEIPEINDLNQPQNPPEQTPKKRAPRGQGAEALRVQKRLQDFDYERSEAWAKIRQHFSNGITHTELKSAANILCLKLNLKLDRDASRDNRVLIKWFQENWQQIEPHINKIHFTDENKVPIADTD